MMRALWTGASGMKAQQIAVDTIAQNISNVNTTGYKAQSTQFKTLLYQTLRTETTTANGENKPSSAQVGLGTRVASLNSLYTDGAMLANESETAVALSGDGFFGIKGADGKTYYTRNGAFTWSLDANGNKTLATPQGNPVLCQEGSPVTIPATAGAVNISQEGEVSVKNEEGVYVPTGHVIAIYQFLNPTGLTKMSNSLLAESDASGQPMEEWSTAGLSKTRVSQYYLEGSNVNVADEMVNLIVSQRAYELNSKAITTSDTMLEQANNLKR